MERVNCRDPLHQYRSLPNPLFASQYGALLARIDETTGDLRGSSHRDARNG